MKGNGCVQAPCGCRRASDTPRRTTRPFDERRQTPHALTTAARTAPLTLFERQSFTLG